ncbi:MAG: hypothetical protein N2691_04980 [Patescibacteria group bacterium]|nr:hypothetical protein [Patescibacteria group bacterium]
MFVRLEDKGVPLALPLKLPEGVDPGGLYSLLKGDPLLLRQILADFNRAASERLGLSRPQSEQTSEEPFSQPAWAQIGLPILKVEVDVFGTLLDLPPSQEVAMQMLGGAMSWRV